jgi:hypothetical protein
MFCLSCGAQLPHEPGEPAGAAAQGFAGAAQAQGSGPRCTQCGGGRTLQAAIGPQMGVRVQLPGGRFQDLPVAPARVCIDCGHVALFLLEDARQYLASNAGR